MTANFVAKVVQSLFDKIDFDKISEEISKIKKYDYSGRNTDEWVNYRIESKEYIRWSKSLEILKLYLKINFENFEQTDLVYFWAKDICDSQNIEKNKKRLYLNNNF